MRFGLFNFDPVSGALLREGVAVRLQPQPARVLALLLERAGEVVGRDELRARIWGEDTFVDFERGLNFCIAQIRSALGDSAGSPRFIETVPRRGYRFIAPVHPAADAAVRTAEVLAPRGRPHWQLLATAVVLLAVIAALLAATRPWRAPQAIRLAVVPFDNETGDPAYDSVATGVADATVARLASPEALSQVSVIGNAAILRTPRSQRDLKAIGDNLHVAFVLLGQVKRDREQVRVIAHLIRVSDQTHLWARTFDRTAFTLGVQAELADLIATSVVRRLEESAHRRR